MSERDEQTGLTGPLPGVAEGRVWVQVCTGCHREVGHAKGCDYDEPEARTIEPEIEQSLERAHLIMREAHRTQLALYQVAERHGITDEKALKLARAMHDCTVHNDDEARAFLRTLHTEQHK